MNTNKLALEKSPYLLQHAHNPVNWVPWGEEAFERARTEDKPIFLSIGYSTCHWCHVMERESFESDAIAAILNEHYIPIKVDREERPDVDRIYMMFVQATTGGGGWPMSVWLTPELKPFFGGTYFPPDNRYGRPGFASVLNYIAQSWVNERPKIMQSGEDILAELKKNSEVKTSEGWLDDKMLEDGFNIFRRSHDPRLGGFGGAPKFPRPSVHNFLIRHAANAKNKEALGMVLLTLDEMAKGGMNDQMGGGFHRYSVDERWFVSHFEKMLYDQAQLAVSYLEAFQMMGDQRHADTARDIFEYVLRDMEHSAGGFYSAEDADSVVDPAHPHEKGEGAFYIWPKAELDQLLGKDSALFCYRFGVEADGNVSNDPQGEFTGRNILFQAHAIEDTAKRFGLDAMQTRLVIASCTQRLMEARKTRVRPHLDDKVLSSWNGLMLSAFSLGAQALNEPRYTAAAKRAADFILTNMYDPTTRILLRRYRDGEAAINGFLDDYSCFTNGLIDLYEASFDLKYLTTAEGLAEKMIELFEDKENGGFFSTSAGDSSLLLRMKEDYDGAEPSGNSMATLALLRLAQFTGRADFQTSAQKTLEAFGPRLRAAPHSLPQMLVAYQFAKRKPKQIILAGPTGASNEAVVLDAVRHRFLPQRTIIRLDSTAAAEWFGKRVEAMANMSSAGDAITAYVCENYTCQLPTNDLDVLVKLLE
jgi:uncharacterized protein YyaL (SSP411 family)